MQLNIDANGDPSLVSRWASIPGTSPQVTNGVLFYARSSLISAFNPTTGSLLWSENRIRSIHWESPIVANGVVCITDHNGNLTAYFLPHP